MAILDLDKLLQDARAAANESGKEWELESDNSGFQIYGAVENPNLSEVSRKVCKQPETIPVNVCTGSYSESLDGENQSLDVIAEHIANFAPGTAIALIRRLQAAEEKLRKIEKISEKSLLRSVNPDKPHKDIPELSKNSEKILEILGKPVRVITDQHEVYSMQARKAA